MNRSLLTSIVCACAAAIGISMAQIVQSAEEILIGASVALTGEYSRTGQDQLNGYNMWIEDVNARGGLLGKKVRLVYYDDESKPATGAKLYEKLITDDKVDLLLGPYSSSVTLAASPIAEKHKFPMVAPGAAATKIWQQGFKNTFGLYTAGKTYMNHILEFGKSQGLKTLALIYEDTAFPRDVAEGVKSTAKSLGMDVVFEEEYSKGTTDFASMIVKMKLKKPDMVIGGSYLPDSTAFVRQSKEYQFNAAIFAFAVGPGLPDFGKNLGADAEGIMGNTQWEHTLNIVGAKEFAAEYKKKYGDVPGYHAAGGYGAGQVLEAAVNAAGGLDKDKLRESLFTLKIDTIFGKYAVDETGMQVGKPGYAIQWINGERHVIFPKEVSTHEYVYPFKAWDKR